VTDDWQVESGPYCRHWSDPSDCDVSCATCGHLCGMHWDIGCMQVLDDGKDCDCNQWLEPEHSK
jgi:hypothetical protein